MKKNKLLEINKNKIKAMATNILLISLLLITLLFILSITFLIF